MPYLAQYHTLLRTVPYFAVYSTIPSLHNTVPCLAQYRTLLAPRKAQAFSAHITHYTMPHYTMPQATTRVTVQCTCHDPRATVHVPTVHVPTVQFPCMGYGLVWHILHRVEPPKIVRAVEQTVHVVWRLPFDVPAGRYMIVTESLDWIAICKVIECEIIITPIRLLPATAQYWYNNKQIYYIY